MQRTPVIIVGAGVAGLTLAYQLSKHGKDVLVIERDTTCGGLARSFRYRKNGKPYIFDIGPKRFHTEDREVLSFLHEILPGNLKTIGRSSSVYFLGKYFRWPIRPSDLTKLPAGVQLKIAADLVTKLFQKTNPSPANFTEEIIAKYGTTLYRSFFEGYTEKFITLPAREVHRDWATTGVNRSIIDPKAKGNSIWELVQAALFPKAVNTKFLYPSSGGFGTFTDTLVKKIRKRKGTVLTNATITRIDYPRRTITLSDGTTHQFETLVWSGNLLSLAQLLTLTFDNIEYLSTVFYQFLVKEPCERPDQWIYYADTDISFVRATLPKNLLPYTTPAGYTTIMVERTCREHDALWDHPESGLPRIREDMIKTGLIKNETAIRATHIQAIRDTYPIYHLKYDIGFAKASVAIHSKYPHIRLLGRSGTFWYNNSDHSIKAALGLAKFLLGKSDTLPDPKQIFSKESVSRT